MGLSSLWWQRWYYGLRLTPGLGFFPQAEGPHLHTALSGLGGERAETGIVNALLCPLYASSFCDKPRCCKLTLVAPAMVKELLCL